MISTYVISISQVELSMLQNSIQSFRNSDDYDELSEILADTMSRKLSVGDVCISDNEHKFLMDCLDIYRTDESMREARLGMNISIPRFEERMEEAMIEQMIKPDYPGLYRRYLENHPEYRQKHPYVYEEFDEDFIDDNVDDDYEKMEN